MSEKGNEPVVTVADVMAWEPCSEYPESRIVALFDGREALTAHDIEALPAPPLVRFWKLDHREFVADHVGHLVACDIAKAMLPVFQRDHPGEPRPRRALGTKLLWLKQAATPRQLDAAHDACWAVARTATGKGAWPIAAATARSGGRATAWQTAWSASWTIANVGGEWEKAWDAAWGRWLGMLVARIEKENER